MDALLNLSLFDSMTDAPAIAKPFVVVEYRTAASLLGSGEMFVRNRDGEILRFSTMTEAKAYADKANKRTHAAFYVAERRQ
jgi:hypothetical protein